MMMMMMMKTRSVVAVVAVTAVFGLAANTNADLVGYYAFEDSGPGALLQDSSGFGNNFETAALSVTTSALVGTHAATFNGSTNEASIAMSSFTELQNATNALTITGWFKANDNSAADDEIFYAGDNATDNTDTMFDIETRQSLDRVRMFLSGDGTTRVEGSNPSVATTGSDNLNVWTFYAFVWNNGSAQLFAGLDSESDLNAGAVDSSFGFTDLHTSNGVFQIARSVDSTSFAGAVDEVTVWNEALSGTQIESLFDGGKAGTAANAIIPEPATLGLLGLATFMMVSGRLRSR